MPITEYDKAHIKDLMAGEGTWFGAMLIRLIAKADIDNLKRLRSAFPEAVEAWEDWYYQRGQYSKNSGD